MVTESFCVFLAHRGGLTLHCVKNPQLGGVSSLSEAPEILENQEGSLCCVYSCPHICVCPTECVHQVSYLGKRADFFKGLSCFCDWAVTVCHILAVFVLPLLMWRPVLADAELRCVVLPCICAWLWNRSARSSTKSRSSSCERSVQCMSFLFSSVKVGMIQSTTSVKKNDDSRDP